LSTAQDPSGRTRVVDLISSHQRVYNVGRLDKSSEGLILVTNDGTLAQYLTHPSFGIEKVYHVVVRGVPKFEDLQTLKHGVHLMEGDRQGQGCRSPPPPQGLRRAIDHGPGRGQKPRDPPDVGQDRPQGGAAWSESPSGPSTWAILSPGAHRRLTSEEVRELKEWAERVAQGLPPQIAAQVQAPNQGPTRSPPY
jgi:23S rRNA pseudouridine2605 synthase